MTFQDVVIAVLAFATVGLVVMLLGLRGRPVPPALRCRRCAFDMVGLVGDPCSECGRDLSRKGGTRTVRRRARWALAAVAAVGEAVMLVPAVRLAPVAYRADDLYELIEFDAGAYEPGPVVATWPVQLSATVTVVAAEP